MEINLGLKSYLSLLQQIDLVTCPFKDLDMISVKKKKEDLEMIISTIICTPFFNKKKSERVSS